MLTHVEQGAKRLTQHLGLSEHLAMIDRAWEAEIGGLKKVARVVALDREALVVEVDSAPALQELTLRRKELIRRLNRHFPSTMISCLTLRIA